MAAGCISPRRIHNEIRKYESSRGSNKSTYWVIFELIWRDFFKCVSPLSQDLHPLRLGWLTVSLGRPKDMQLRVCLCRFRQPAARSPPPRHSPAPFPCPLPQIFCTQAREQHLL